MLIAYGSAASAHSDLRSPAATSMSLRRQPHASISHSSLRHPPTPSVPPTYTATCPRPPPSPCHPPLAVTHCHIPHAPAAASLTPQPPCPSRTQCCAPHAHTATSLMPSPSCPLPPCHRAQPDPGEVPPALSMPAANADVRPALYTC